MKEIEFINAKLNREQVQVPKFLYKYRPFDKYTFDMFDNEYVYLCPAENLDDPSECKVDFTIQDIYDLQTNSLTFKGIDMILEFIKPHCNEENFQQLKSRVYRVLTTDGVAKGQDLLEVYFDMQGIIPDEPLVALINQLRNIPEKIDEPEGREIFEKMFELAYSARKDLGICSLSELKNFDEMWWNYADGAKGYCIEYDMSTYEKLSLLYPVVYQDNRETNITTNILGAFIGELIFGISNGQIAADKSQFMRLFLTKDEKWSYQSEWRLLGDARQRLQAPQISAIFLGKYMVEQDKQKIIEYCKNHNIRVEQNL